MRTITSRNLLGGFCGGMLGILAFAWSTLLLPIGCLAGVMLGFWYQELWIVATSAWREPVRMLRWALSWNIWSKCVAFWNDLKSNAPTLTAMFSGLAQTLACALRFVLAPFRWAAKHPMNQANLIRCALGLISVLLLGYTVGYPIARSMEASNHSLSGFFVIILALSFLGLLLGIMMYAFMPDENITLFYRRWEKYSRRAGALRVAIFDLRAIASVGILTGMGAGVITVALIVGTPLITTALLCCFVGAGLTRSMVGVFALLKRTDHWICFGATLLTTITAAALTRHHLQGIWLWLVAVITGCCAGLLSEAVRRGLLRCEQYLPYLRRVSSTDAFELTEQWLTTLGKKLMSAGKLLVPIGTRWENMLLGFMR